MHVNGCIILLYINDCENVRLVWNKMQHFMRKTEERKTKCLRLKRKITTESIHKHFFVKKEEK